MTPDSFIREKHGVYWVLAEYDSSSGDDVYEVRTSQRDHKTYCTCRGWIVKLNQNKVDKNIEAVCTHIKKFREAKPKELIQIFGHEEFHAYRNATAASKAVPIVNVPFTRG